MAHRNIKITRDIVQTCNKLSTFSKLDLSTLPLHRQIEISDNASPNAQNNKKHYSASCKNETTNSTNPETVNANKRGNNNAEFKTHNDTTNNLPLFTTSTRFYSSSSKHGKYEGECLDTKKKCPRDHNCPRFTLDNCVPSKGSDCRRVYQDPCCTKKMAPYPSYSELCAYRLEEDPSECQQCPWQKCRGVEDIKPQQGRKYHTSTKEMNMAMIPVKNRNFFPQISQKQCDARKEPCKEPPPKCKKEEKVKKEKCPEKKKKPEKKCDNSLFTTQSWIISGSLKNLDLQKLYHSQLKLDLLQESLGEQPTLAQRIIYKLKECPKDKDKCPKHEIKPPVIDHTIREKYKPKDPCCRDAKKGRQAPKRPKVFVPDPRNY